MRRVVALHPNTSASLLMRLRDPEDNDSWQLFTDVYGPLIRAFCRSRGFQAGDIDDVTQEVLTKVTFAIRAFEYQPDKGSFRSWLATITANKMRDFVRKRLSDEKLVELVEEFAVQPETHPQWSTMFVQKIFNAACERVRPTMEPSTWRCFEATWIDHREPVEVADELQIPVHSVYVNKSRVLKKLESEFKMLSEDLPLAE